MSGYELRSIADQEHARDGLKANRQSERDDVTTLPEVVLVSPGRNGLVTDASGMPVDKYQLVFIILLIHGIGTLMPWNMFINADDYFRNYKLESSIANSTIVRDRTDAELSDLRKNFLTYLSWSAQLPNVLFNGLNLIVNLGSGNLRLRVNAALAVEAVIFVFTIVLAVVNSYAWPGKFVTVTMISVVLLNMASGIYQNCVFGIGAKFPGKYTNAILIGSNLSGTFTSVVNLLSVWLAPEAKTAAMYYFITALFIILICLISYNLINLNPFFRHYDQAGSHSAANTANKLEIATASDSASLKRIRDESTTSDNKLASSPESSYNTASDIPEALRKTVDAMVPRPKALDDASGDDDDLDDSFMGELTRKWRVFEKCWPQCMNVFFTFFITLALFPSVMASIKRTGNLFSDKYFTGVACFLVFNLTAMIGNLISGWTTWPGRERVWLLVAIRVLFIPFFLFCNFNPTTRHWPVLIHSDISFMLGNVLLGLSSGYLSSLCMMFASSNLKPNEAPKGGMLAAFFLVLGILIGISTSFIFTQIVEMG